jgi:hypothetical protein
VKENGVSSSKKERVYMVFSSVPIFTYGGLKDTSKASKKTQRYPLDVKNIYKILIVYCARVYGGCSSATWHNHS